MFAERLVAALKAFAGVLVSDAVTLLMSAQSGAGGKFLVAVWDLAGIVSLVGMCAFNVVLQMGVSQEGFCAVGFWTFEWAFVSMRAEMLGQSSLAVERPGAVFVGTGEMFLSGSERSAGDGDGCFAIAA